jgi:hypothetical protein
MARRAPAKFPGGVPAGRTGTAVGRPGRLPHGRPYLTLRHTASLCTAETLRHTASLCTAETLRNTASLGAAEREQRLGRS